MVEPGGLGDIEMTEEEMRVYEEEERKNEEFEKKKKEMDERPGRRQMKKRSPMCDHFSEVLVGGLLKFGKCKYCNRNIKVLPEINAHFIDPEWNLHKKIISFFLVKGQKGDDIGKALEQCLMEWGINKVMTITVDNASANYGGVGYIRKKMIKTGNSIVEGKYFHMRCDAHIINLIVTDGLKELDELVKRVRVAVRYIRHGPSRIARFKELADLEKEDGEAFLSLDVCTRWNSTYLMLKTAIYYVKVFVRYEEEDPMYTLDLNSEKAPGTPVDSDWENAKKMADFLGHFYELTLSVSATLRVTVNQFVMDIAEINVVLEEWADSDDVLRQSMAKKMQVKYDKYWGRWHEEAENENEKGRGKVKKKEEDNVNMFVFAAAVLDPRFKLSNFTKLAIEEMCGEINVDKAWEVVKTFLYALFEEYKAKYSLSDARLIEKFGSTIHLSQRQAVATLFASHLVHLHPPLNIEHYRFTSLGWLELGSWDGDDSTDMSRCSCS